VNFDGSNTLLENIISKMFENCSQINTLHIKYLKKKEKKYEKSPKRQSILNSIEEFEIKRYKLK
jgi:hypothetical protein